MTYEEFTKKWRGRSPGGEFGGVITVLRNDNYKLKHMHRVRVVADVWFTPKWHGWGGDEKSRRRFYRDAKLAGVRSNKSTICEWYKIIDIIE